MGAAKNGGPKPIIRDRNAGTGQFVPTGTAAKKPATTIRDVMPRKKKG